MPIGEAFDAGAVIDELYVDEDAWLAAPDSSALRATVRRATQAGIRVWSLGPGVLARVSDTVNPQGLLAVAPRRTTSVAEVCAGTGPVLVLVDVADPGNLGTLARAAEAAGAAGLVVAGSGTDPFGPKAVRAAAGSLLRLAVAEVDDAGAAMSALAEAGRQLVATVAAGGAAPEDVDLARSPAIVVGSEAHGLPAEIIDAASVRVTIPIVESVESLNVAVAGSVVLFEAARQRRRGAGASDGPLVGTDWTIDSSTDRVGDR